MPYYTCSNGTCPTGGQPFSMNSAGQTFCPRCNTAGALSAAAPPVVAPTTRTRVIQTSNQMDAVDAKVAAEVDDLISKWEINTVSTDEAKKTKDYLYKLGSDKRKRIDREGGVKNGSNVYTHGRFRLQFSSLTYAGVQIEVDRIMDAAVIRRAFRESINARRYVEVYLG